MSKTICFIENDVSKINFAYKETEHISVEKSNEMAKNEEIDK